MSGDQEMSRSSFESKWEDFGVSYAFIEYLPWSLSERDELECTLAGESMSIHGWRAGDVEEFFEIEVRRFWCQLWSYRMFSIVIVFKR